MKIEQNKKLINAVNSIDIEIIDSGYAWIDSTWNGRDICSPYTRLYYVESGEGFLEWGGTVHTMKSGDVFLIPAGLTYNYWCDNAMRKLYFHINIYKPNKYDLMLDCKSCARLTVDSSKIKQIIGLYKSKAFIDALVLKQEIFRTVIRSLKSIDLPDTVAISYSPVVQDAINFVEQNLSMSLSCRKIAQFLYISESKLSKAFKSETGISIGKYIDDLILFSAEKMLLKSDMSISQISERLGFCDQFYFSRKFKLRYGETPRKYRKRMKRQEDGKQF